MTSSRLPSRLHRDVHEASGRQIQGYGRDFDQEAYSRRPGARGLGSGPGSFTSSVTASPLYADGEKLAGGGALRRYFAPSVNGFHLATFCGIAARVWDRQSEVRKGEAARADVEIDLQQTTSQTHAPIAAVYRRTGSQSEILQTQWYPSLDVNVKLSGKSLPKPQDADARRTGSSGQYA